MSQYHLVLPENRHATVVKKRILLRPSLLGLRKTKIIAYSVDIKPAFQGRDKYYVFRTEKNGRWLKERDNILIRAIKQAVDAYEIPQGANAYKELF